ncbi:MAG: hypothetical protein PHS57_01150 [Alphaproteobacteria bacterium]|nr:hypothetical protein [Alphaproteobacteria bacterium]
MIASASEKEKKESLDTPIADSMKALEKELLQNYKGALDRAAHKRGAPTVEELSNNLSDLSKRIADIDEDNVIPGGISTGADLSVKDRKSMGDVPAEIKSNKTLKNYKVRYEKLCRRKDELRVILNDMALSDLQKGRDSTNKIVFIITSAFLAPSAIVTTIATICGNDDKIFLLSLFGSTTAIGAGAAIIAIKFNSAEAKPANDVGLPNKHRITEKFNAYKSAVTQHGSNVLNAASKYADSLCHKGKTWVEDNAKELPRAAQGLKRRVYNRSPKNQ